MNSWLLILPNVFVYRLVQVSALRKIPDWPVFLCGLPHITGLENHPETGKMPPYVTDSITILLFETSFDRKDRSAAALFIALYADDGNPVIIVNKADFTRHAKYPETSCLE